MTIWTYRVVVHPLTYDDQFEIFEFLTEFGGQEMAQDKLNEIEETILSLSEFPHRGTLRHEVLRNLRIVPSDDKGVIAFAVNEDLGAVLIYAVTYGGQDWARRIRSRRRWSPGQTSGR